MPYDTCNVNGYTLGFTDKKYNRADGIIIYINNSINFDYNIITIGVSTGI